MKEKRKEFLKQFYLKNKINFIVALFTSIMLAGFNLIVSYLLQLIIDTATGNDMNKLYMLMIYSACTIVGFGIVVLLRGVFIPKYTHKAVKQYKNQAIKKVFEKNITAFNEHSSTDYISSLTNDITQIEEAYIKSIFEIITNIIMFVGAVVLMFINNYLLALIGIGLSILPFFVTIFFGKKMQINQEKVSQENASFMHNIKDALTGFSVIKNFKAEKKVVELESLSNQNLEHAKEKNEALGNFVQMLAMTTSIFAQFGVFIMGAYFAIKYKSLSAGTIILFVQLMNFVVQPVAAIPPLVAKRKAVLPLIDKLSTLVTYEPETNKQKLTFNDSIKLENLSLEIDDKKILEDITYEFKPGKSYAIVGPSGAGKSSLINTIMGKNNYTGELSFDNENAKNCNMSSIYDLMALVEQNVFIFDACIKDNVTMYNSYEDNLIMAACKKSGLESLVNERGIDFKCGDAGSNLSGGEKQRISIARALIKDAKLLLMDEATSALDNETSVQVTDTILNLKDTTRIVITHRLEEQLLKKYDYILVMKNGRIIESDNFDNLMSRDSFFKSMYTISQ